KKPTKRKNHVKKTVKIKLVSKPKLAHHNPIHNHKVHHKKHPIHKKIHHKIKKALKQSHYRARSLKHMKITKIFIKRKNIEKAKKNYSLALINYFKMPGHENEIYFKLRSLLKQIESLETHPHYDFHESSKKIMKLKKDQKKITHETLYAIKDFNLA
ncbi:MAG: hypothetical protein Q8O84_01280, partial [Nanoarchaeota archaeon]|nr:hypothetical protein [Nanoarchaeota archaeon]